MTGQMTLFTDLDRIAPVQYEPGLSIEERFEQFRRANPHVTRRLADMALALRRAGVRRYGMKGLFEKLRFDYTLQTGSDDFKLNNNYTALYARLLMHMHPELDGFFETRRRAGEGE